MQFKGVGKFRFKQFAKSGWIY